MSRVGASLGQALRVAAAELGMASAARLFVREVAAAAGVQGVAELRDRLGREYPVLDLVAGRLLAGAIDPGLDVDAALAALAGARRLVVVGVEADALDALLPRLHGVEVGLCTEGRSLMPEWRRVLANFDGQVQAIGLADVALWAGGRSAILTFVYGGDGHVLHVSPQWLRISGPDVRTSFRSLIAWDVLGGAPEVYPRWSAAVDRTSFSEVIGPEGSG